MTRRNPVIGRRLLGIRYEGGEGKTAGSQWQHDFESPVEVIGGPGGSVILRSRTGERLWDYFDVEKGKGIK